MKKFVWVLAIISAFGLGIYLASGHWWPWSEKYVSEQATAIVERIEKVAKLVTVSGHFSEIYDYKDYYGYDWSIFRKKALIRVQATVHAGYDLDDISVDAASKTRTITISRLPRPEILSIDHDLDYYDLREGTFNSFTEEDLNRLNVQAKNYIREVALKSNLLNEAEARGQELLETIRFMVETQGWQLILENEKFDGDQRN